MLTQEARSITVALPDEVNSAILALRTRKEFAQCSYSEIVRYLVNAALDEYEKETQFHESVN